MIYCDFYLSRKLQSLKIVITAHYSLSLPCKSQEIRAGAESPARGREEKNYVARIHLWKGG